MAVHRIITPSRQRKRRVGNVCAHERMIAARARFFATMHEWLHTTDAREGQIAIDGTAREMREMAAVVDRRIVPGFGA